MSINEKKHPGEKIGKGIYISAGIFVFMLILSAGLKIFDIFFIEKSNKNISQEITKIQQELDILKQDENIKIYNLISLNKGVLDDFQKKSQITDIIAHFTKIGNTNAIGFEGFSYSNGVITSNVSATKNNTLKFMKYFRKEVDEMFELDFVNNFSGEKDIDFQVQFHVK